MKVKIRKNQEIATTFDIDVDADDDVVDVPGETVDRWRSAWSLWKNSQEEMLNILAEGAVSQPSIEFVKLATEEQFTKHDAYDRLLEYLSENYKKLDRTDIHGIYLHVRGVVRYARIKNPDE